MVKNIKGGSKGKSYARKLSSSCVATRSVLRLSKCNLEKYACVTKYFGQGRCSVKTTDDMELQCVIRNKFKGRSRLSSMVTVGTILLIGLREWEGDNYRICDLLEVYDNDDYNQLKSIPSTKVGNLDKYISTLQTSAISGGDDFIFTEDDVDNNALITNQKVPVTSLEINDDEIDIDDI